MFDFIIRYTEQVSEDAWAVRYRSVKLPVNGLKTHLTESGRSYMSPGVVDVQNAETPDTTESPDSTPNNRMLQSLCEINDIIKAQGRCNIVKYGPIHKDIHAVLAQQHHA